MLDFLATLPGPTFLLYFSLATVLIIGLARFALWVDGSTRHAMPGPTRLQPRSLAALRAGRQGLIQLALLRLWQTEQLYLEPGAGLRRPRLVSRGMGTVPRDPTEALLHRFAFGKSRRPGEFFKDRALRLKVEQGAASVYQELERMRLLRSPAQRRTARWVRWLALLLLLLLGGTRLTLDLLAGQALGPLPAALLLALAFTWLMLRPPVTTRLGRQFLRVMRKRFAWMKSAPSEESDPGLVMALFGVAGLAKFPELADFHRVFMGTGRRAAGDGEAGSDGDGDGGNGGD